MKDLCACLLLSVANWFVLLCEDWWVCFVPLGHEVGVYATCQPMRLLRACFLFEEGHVCYLKIIVDRSMCEIWVDVIAWEFFLHWICCVTPKPCGFQSVKASPLLSSRWYAVEFVCQAFLGELLEEGIKELRFRFKYEDEHVVSEYWLQMLHWRNLWVIC